MSRLLALSLVAGLASMFSGCAMCCAPFDCDYPVVAGRWTRHNPSSGRVGSAFDEAGGPSDVLLASTEGVPATALPAPPQQPQSQPMPPAGNFRAPSGTYSQPPARMAPGTRSVIPRTMGENYLPRGQ